MSYPHPNYFFPAISRPGRELSVESAVRVWREKNQNEQPFTGPQLNAVVRGAVADAAWCHGGYMEYREACFRGTYMEKKSKYLHLGIDYSAPAGIAVGFPIKAKVLHRDSFTGRSIDWGGRIFIQPEGTDWVFLLCHMDPGTLPSEGALVGGDSLCGALGASSVNGGVWPHLHVQAMSLNNFTLFKAEAFKNLDGYATLPEKDEMLRKFPNPEKILQMLITRICRIPGLMPLRCVSYVPRLTAILSSNSIKKTSPISPQ